MREARNKPEFKVNMFVLKMVSSLFIPCDPQEEEVKVSHLFKTLNLKLDVFWLCLKIPEEYVKERFYL